MTTIRERAARARLEQARRLRERYEGGASVDDLQRESGLSHGTVLNRLHQVGTFMRTPAGTRQLQAGAQQEHARRELGARLRFQYEQVGLSVEALAVQEGLSARTVRRRLFEAGAVLRSRKSRTADGVAAEARRGLAADLRDRYEAGASVPALAAGCGLSASTVYRLLHLARAVMRPQFRHPTRPERTAAVRESPPLPQPGPDRLYRRKTS